MRWRFDRGWGGQRWGGVVLYWVVFVVEWAELEWAGMGEL